MTKNCHTLEDGGINLKDIGLVEWLTLQAEGWTIFGSPVLVSDGYIAILIKADGSATQVVTFTKDLSRWPEDDGPALAG